jgi:dTDP-4-dehydrorhamnose reductase
MILGVNGLIGDACYHRLCEKTTDYRIFAFDHARADITNRRHIEPLMEYIQPTVVVNCAAVNDQEMCEQAKDGAFSVNASGPAILAEQCLKYGAKLVHFSSSTVFDGKRCTPYTEKCRPAPLSTHGKSKLEGEKAIAKVLPNHLIIRSGWCFHFAGQNPVTEWLSNAERGMEVVTGGQRGSPTFVPDLVDGMIKLVEKDAMGTFHFANSDAATWGTFAEAVSSISRLPGKMVEPGQLRTAVMVAQPDYAVLSSKKYSETVMERPRPWMEALKQCLFQMDRYKP